MSPRRIGRRRLINAGVGVEEAFEMVQASDRSGIELDLHILGEMHERGARSHANARPVDLRIHCGVLPVVAESQAANGDPIRLYPNDGLSLRTRVTTSIHVQNADAIEGPEAQGD